MRLLLDTQILLRMATEPEKLPRQALSLLEDGANILAFSVITVWEVTIKRGLNRTDFQADPHSLRSHLLAEEFLEIVLTGDHAVAVRHLPLIHKDPFDRALIAQAAIERMTFLTTNTLIARYPGDILLV